MEKNQTQKSYGLSTLKQARTIIGLASVIFGTLIAILVPLWGRSTFSDLTYDEFRQAYFMPQKNRIADLEAQADFQEAMSKKDMIGLLWLQFAANVLLVAGGLILFWFNAKTEKAYDYAFIILCVICAVMEIVTFAVYYPGIFLDPKTAFGVLTLWFLQSSIYYCFCSAYFGLFSLIWKIRNTRTTTTRQTVWMVSVISKLHKPTIGTTVILEANSQKLNIKNIKKENHFN